MLAVIIVFTACLGAASPEAAKEPLDAGETWASAGVSREMGRVTGHVLSVLPQARQRASGHVHLCFHDDPDVQFIKAMAAGGAEGGVALTVWTAASWRSLLGNITYQTRATHVLVGPRVWLLGWLDVIEEKTSVNNISKHATQWVFVSTQYKNRDFQEALLHRLPEQLHFLLLQRVTRPSSLPFNKSTARYELQQENGERERNEDGYRVRGVDGHMQGWRLEKDEVESVNLEDRKRVKETSQQGTISGKSLDLRDGTEKQSEEMLSRDAAEGESLDQAGETKAKPAKREGFETLSESKSIKTMFSTDMNTVTSLESVLKPKRLTEALFQQDTRSSSTSKQVTIELLLAVYANDGSTSFRKRGYWTPAIGLLLNGPLQAPFAPYFGGRVLTLTTIHKPGVFEPGSDGRMESAGGYIAQMMRYLHHHLNFTSFVTTTNTFGTLWKNGSWNGMIGFLTRREADLAPLDFSPSWTRLSVVDFSEWFSTDGIIIISQAPRPLMPPFLLLQVFPIWLWASVVAMGLVSGHALWGMELIYYYQNGKGQDHQYHHYYHHDTHHPSYWRTLAVVLKLFLVQGSNERYWSRLWSGRLLSSCLFLVVLSVVALYQGSIIAFLAVPRNTRPIDSAADLMERLDSVVPIVRKNTVYYNFIVNFESYRPIAASFQFYQDSFLNTWSFFRRVEEGEYALIDTYSSGVGRAANFEVRGKSCRFYVSRKLMKTDLDIMIHPQNSVYRHHFDQALRQLRSFGLIDKIKADYITSPCKQDILQRDPLSLSLTQMQSAFYVLAVGSILSFLCLIGELAAACGGCSAPLGT